MNKIHIIILYIFLQYKAHTWNNRIYSGGNKHCNSVLQNYWILFDNAM